MDQEENGRMAESPTQPADTNGNAENVTVSTADHSTWPSNVFDSRLQSCQLCNEYDNIDMVRCDNENCKAWFHFVCVGVTREQVEREFWACKECMSKIAAERSPEKDPEISPEISPVPSVVTPNMQESQGPKQKDNKSTKSSLSSRSRRSQHSAVKRRQLELERIEEERKLREARERDYLNKKYQTLAEGINSESDDDRSVDTELESNRSKITSEWVNAQRSNGMKPAGETHVSSSSTAPTKPYQTGYGPDFWQNYHDRLKVRHDKPIETETRVPKFGLAATTVSESPQRMQSYSRAGYNQTPRIVNSNDYPRLTVTFANPKAVESSNRRQTTYGEFSDRNLGINSSMIGNEANRGSTKPTAVNRSTSAPKNNFDVPTSSNNDRKNTAVNSSVANEDAVTVSRNVTFTKEHQKSSERDQQISISLNGGIPTSSVVIQRNINPLLTTQSTQHLHTGYRMQQNFTSTEQSLGGPTSRQNDQSFVGTNSRGQDENSGTVGQGYSNPTRDGGYSSSTRGGGYSNPLNVGHGNFSSIGNSTSLPINNGPQQTFTSSSNHLSNSGGAFMGTTTPARLTAEQIAARHTMPKTLPKFTGSPKDWPMFISAYENSTSTCGLSNSENISRLRDSLGGDAMDAVSCILFNPESVPEIIETLKMLFGRPELVIESLMEELQDEPTPRENDLNGLIRFALKVRNLVETIRKFGPLSYLETPNLLNRLVARIPTQTRINWAYFVAGNPTANLASFSDWLYGLAKVTTRVVGTRKSSDSPRKESNNKNKPPASKANHVNAHMDNSSQHQNSGSNARSQVGDSNPTASHGTRQCPICSIESCKQVQECSKFKSLTPAERWNETKAKRLCYSCFGKHRYFKCKSRKKCQINGCQLSHHALLHDNERQAAATNQQNLNSSAGATSNNKVSKSNASSGAVTGNCNSLSMKQVPAIFKIIPIILYGRKKAVITFAYLDEGSDLTMMERELAYELGLEGKPDVLNVRWAFKDSEEKSDSETVSVRISGDFKSARNYKIVDVHTVEKLYLPTQSITRDWLDSFEHLRNLPISTYRDASPRILIGLHSSKLMVSSLTVEGKWCEPIACKTRLGWVVQGPDAKDATQTSESDESLNTKVCLSICDAHADNELHQLVKEFLSFESFGVRAPEKILESTETIRAREIMEATTVKKDGRYETGLLWRYDNIHLPDSYGMALRRLNSLENKMRKDPTLATKLCDQLTDFVAKKYIRKLQPHEIEHTSDRTWYLPIFVVFNPKKPNKVRTVWDAAAKVKDVSLNSVLLKGPDQLVPLPDVLRRFRERLYGITGDIGEMYHRIGVIKKDRTSQRFLWRNRQSNKKPDVYEMEVLTFGASCSPSSAQFIKNKNAMEYKHQFPVAADAIVHSTYIDDMLDCTHTKEEALSLVRDVKFIHKQASFEFGKITSNSKEILQALGVEETQQVKNLNLSTEVTAERVLGMFWNTSTDTFTFSLKYAKIDETLMSGDRIPTKREVLRALMSIFDPLGLIANVLVYVKILLQKVWRKGTNWDEQISDSLQGDWFEWLRYLPQVERIEIPRLYSLKLSPRLPMSIQMHTFVDASEACAAATYFRFEDEFGVDCVLVGAKTKVAPNKPLTVPRLELQAAVLGTRLAGSIGPSQRFAIDKNFYWSDSQCVISWIMSETRKYNQFVAFRVGEILDNSAECEWNWVNTDDNVADEATKSSNRPDVSSSSRWFKAPPFLYRPEIEWNTHMDKSQFVTDEELRPPYLLAQFVKKEEDVINPNDFSDWRRLLRTMAFVFRFIDNLRRRNKSRKTGPLSRFEYVQAENHLYRQAQKYKFTDEIAVIQHNSTIRVDKRKEFDKSSPLKTLSPYIDEFGVLRQKSRLEAAKQLTFQTKRPIILPRDHHITKLIVLNYHQKLHHLNHGTTLNNLHQKYVIPSMRRVLKSVIHNICQRCKNDRASPKVPEMADLPPARVATSIRSFTFVGVDYFGPFWVKVNTTKRKRWGVLFTCLTVRAVHIELAEALTTNECILAVRRFIARRGNPAEYYSDNGTNFHGSEKELQKEFKKLNFARIEETFTTSTSQWNFNPPLAPHMGGSWERMIRTVKATLRKALPTRLPTQKMFETFLAEIENILNSRPLTYVHLDHEGDDVLTPNHFLLGSAEGARSPGKFDESNLLRDDWKAVQHMTDLFWRRFNVEYLPTLTRRTKWFTDVKPIEVGDVVVVIDDKHERNNWPKGIVEEVYPGRGQRIRKASIRLVKGRDNLPKIDVTKVKHQTLVRPVAKLAVLDVKDKLSSYEEAVNGREHVENSTPAVVIGQH